MIVNGTIEFIDVKWFSTIGIVLCQDNLTLEYKCYIKDTSKVNGPPGNYTRGTEEGDIADIMAWGVKFPLEVAKELFNVTMDEIKYWKECNLHYCL